MYLSYVAMNTYINFLILIQDEKIDQNHEGIESPVDPSKLSIKALKKDVDGVQHVYIARSKRSNGREKETEHKRGVVGKYVAIMQMHAHN